MGSVEKLEVEKHPGFELGEIVYLNSGSPPLTVAAIFEGNSGLWLGLMWVNGGGIHQDTQLPAVCVSKEPVDWDDWYARDQNSGAKR